MGIGERGPALASGAEDRGAAHRPGRLSGAHHVRPPRHLPLRGPVVPTPKVV